MGLLVRLFVNCLALGLTAYLFDGIHINGSLPLLVSAVVLAGLNTFVRPLLMVITLPLNILSLGVLTFFINGLMLKLTSSVVPGFHVRGFWTAVGGALVLSIISTALSVFVSDRGHIEVIYVERRRRW